LGSCQLSGGLFVSQADEHRGEFSCFIDPAFSGISADVANVDTYYSSMPLT